MALSEAAGGGAASPDPDWSGAAASGGVNGSLWRRHDIVVIGYDDERQVAHVVDNDRDAVQLVPYEALARARASRGFPVPTRHTYFEITWPDRLPDLASAAGPIARCSAG